MRGDRSFFVVSFPSPPLSALSFFSFLTHSLSFEKKKIQTAAMGPEPSHSRKRGPGGDDLLVRGGRVASAFNLQQATRSSNNPANSLGGARRRERRGGCPRSRERGERRQEGRHRRRRRRCCG